MTDSKRAVMTIADKNRLRGDAPMTTHLARYEWAHDHGATCVLDVTCPVCGEYPRRECRKR